jgi:hypothetical protein
MDDLFMSKDLAIAARLMGPFTHNSRITREELIIRVLRGIGNGASLSWYVFVPT